MDKKMIWGVTKSIFKIALALAVVLLVYNLGMKAYDFGYRIFAEEPVELGTGRTVSVSIVEGKTVSEIGEILEEKGLIRDAKLFYFQEMFSEYKGELKPGVYELSTGMTPYEMMEIMSASEEETE
ncbi:MAG: endolytic transglycosylase MltG [Lachnospiraceae bacterium]|nr:endolytic transglycosylase MltG [Lachnospiraceae bacterium]